MLLSGACQLERVKHPERLSVFVNGLVFDPQLRAIDVCRFIGTVHTRTHARMIAGETARKLLTELLPLVINQSVSRVNVFLTRFIRKLGRTLHKDHAVASNGAGIIIRHEEARMPRRIDHTQARPATTNCRQVIGAPVELGMRAAHAPMAPVPKVHTTSTQPMLPVRF